MKIRIIAALIAAIWVSAPGLARQPELMTIDAWRSDLREMADTVRSVHPNPFARTDEDAFGAAVAELDRRIPELADHEIMLEMSTVLAMLGDGHTRLTLPRPVPEAGFRLGHSSDPEPTVSGLNFNALPMRIEPFGDGYFIVSGGGSANDLVGSQVLQIGRRPIDVLVEVAARFVQAENVGARRLQAADRLSLLEVLDAGGVSREACGTRFSLARNGETFERCLPLDPGALREMGEANLVEEQPHSVIHAPDRGVTILTLREMSSPAEMPISASIQRAITLAERDGSRLLIDLRSNTGGNNANGRAVVLAVLSSPDINTYGRFFVLTGPKTFSAAQSLLNALQQYTRVVFVGEPSGSHPDHYGDSRRSRLANSGLTLRVSTLHWSSGVANDPRDATTPHLDVATLGFHLTSQIDPVIDTIASLGPLEAIDLVREGLGAERIINAYLVAQLDLLSPEPATIRAPDYLELGAEFEAGADDLAAFYAYRIGANAFPADQELARRADATLDRLE